MKKWASWSVVAENSTKMRTCCNRALEPVKAAFASPRGANLAGRSAGGDLLSEERTDVFLITLSYIGTMG